jgi:hypothetical protein
MKLSLKASQFILEALDFYQKYHDQRLKNEGLSEEDISDLVNDREFLEAIKQDLEKYRDELVHQCESVKADA